MGKKPEYTDFLTSVHVILVSPDESSNIGAVCRSMKTMGISNLAIVNPKTYDENKISYISVHAFDIYKNRKEYDSLSRALKDMSVAAGITRRKGKKRKYNTFTAEEFVLRFLSDFSGLSNGGIALVFGNEEHGLTDEELSECTVSVDIPSSPDFPSLNLSHAVQVVCYEIYKNYLKLKTEVFNAGSDSGRQLKTGPSGPETSISGSPAKSRAVNISDMEKLSSVIADSLRTAGFFKMTDDSDIRSFFRDIFSRACLNEKEIKKLTAIFKKLSALAGKK